MGDSTKVTVLRIRRIAHEGGYLSYEVDARAADGQIGRYTFTGNVFVGPVVITGNDKGAPVNVVVHHPRRFGEFAAEQWVRRFFAEWREEDAHTEDIAAVTDGWLTTGWQARCG